MIWMLLCWSTCLTIRLLISALFFLAILTIRANKYDMLNK